jgi:HlyD family secretion protein
VAVLDTNARLQATLVQARQDVEIARSKLARVEAGARKGEIEAQRAEISRLEVELKDEAAVDRTERNILQAQLAEESKVKKARINRSRSELAHAETELKRYQLLYGEGAIETSTYETKQLARDTAATSLAEAIADLGQTERTLQQRIARNRATYSQKVNTLQQQILQAKANLDRIVEVRPTDVRVARSELDRSIADVEKAKVDLETSYVRAPRSGQILKIYTRPGEVVGNDGILSLGQTDRMQVVAEVYETDIRRVRVGQKATVISDVLPEKLRGRVTRIGLQISQQDVFSTDPVADVDRRVIEVKIDLDPESSKRVVDLTNLQVEISIDP